MLGEVFRRGVRAAACIVCTVAIALCTSCGNNPYPDSDATAKIVYSSFGNPPRTLDPQVSYSANDQRVLAHVYETPLEYHFLARPYRLIPGLLTEVPQPEPMVSGSVRYRFSIRAGVRYIEDDCFELSQTGARTREMRATDFLFALQRIADPEVNSPAITTFEKLAGLRGFRERLEQLRESDPAFGELRIDEQYARAGIIEGARVLGPYELEVILDKPYPQILYWFAMPFTSPVPWEAIAHYDGEQNEPFAEVAIGTGPFRLARYDKQSRIVLERNPHWYGVEHPEWKAPGATYPSEGEPGDRENGLLDAAGKSLPLIDRIELLYEKESIPRFTKFLQGYYDASGIIKESFDRVVTEDRLSPEMEALGMRLRKSVEPTIYYLGFNMLDPVVGHAAGERGRKLRQAMSLAIDTESYLDIFRNGRGIPAQTPLPPGLYGYDPEYKNPYRSPDLERATKLLTEAGYPGGIDPQTLKPLKLSFDTPDTSAQGRLTHLFYTDSWAKLGIRVEIEATNYNKFQQKVRDGAYQIYQWGWIADYPDPENFLFLLWSKMGQTKTGGPNSANFSNAEFDALYLKVRDLPDGPERIASIDEMRKLLERECPWIPLFHGELYSLYQPWLLNVKPTGLSSPTLKYHDLEPQLRAKLRERWNQPIHWPAYALAGLIVTAVVPGIFTFFRERQ